MKQTLEWIRDKGEVYLASHSNVGKNRVENEQLLHEHNKFKGEVKVEYFIFKLALSDLLLIQIIMK